MFSKDYVPQKPFPDFKWKWASLQCTEGINDPVVLLGILFRMRKLEGKGLKYSSPEFANELVELSNDIRDSVDVDLAKRTGKRNIIRNSGQYWKAVGLIPDNSRGLIRLTDFGRRVAEHDISQTEFSAITVQTFKLPNSHIQTAAECLNWESHSLSGCHAQIEDYVNFIIWHRSEEISVADWPNCCEAANDFRIAREFLLFLENYGYLVKETEAPRDSEQYRINTSIESEIAEILATPITDASLQDILNQIRTSEVASEVERKRVQNYRMSRPNQARFRHDVLASCQRCIITNVAMPEVLEAAHIKPFKYNGEDTIANGFAMRTDIHTLFDSGHLRISETGVVELSTRARMDYGATIPPKIVLPDFTNLDFVRWRWENYNGI